MASIGDKGVLVFGKNYVFHKVPYNGSSTTFSVDQGATVAVCVHPASGPTASIATASGGLHVITLAAAGANDDGNVIICTNHEKTVASSKP